MRYLAVAFVAALLAVAAPRLALATDCESNNDCGSFEVCVDGMCVGVDPAEMCETDADCDAGMTCMYGYCVGGEVPIGECETDADCGPEGRCLDGYCVFDGGPAPTECESDAECTAAQLCVWGMCMEREWGYCRADADCGSGMICNGCYCESLQGTCATAADCGQYETCETFDAAGADPDYPTGQGECTFSRGWCILDWENIPIDGRCNSFCEVVGRCEGSGEGSSGGGAAVGTESREAALEDDEEGACLQYCSYLLLEGDGQDEAEALLACVAANAAATCDDLFEACADEVEATSAAFGDTYTDVDAGAAPGSGGAPIGEGSGTQRNSLGDSLSKAFGQGGAGGGGSGGGGSGGGGSGATGGDGGAGCAMGGAPLTGAAGLLGLLLGLGLAVLRRRA
jgi:hypothetical protein